MLRCECIVMQNMLSFTSIVKKDILKKRAETFAGYRYKSVR